MKMKEKEKQSKALYILYIYISIYSVGLHDSLRTSSRELYIKKIYKTKYLRLFTPFPNLITKESYNWWVTMRSGNLYKNIWRKISKSVGRNYREASGEFRRCTKWLRNFADKQDFAALRNWPLAWSDLLPMALTSSFQLRFTNRLKRWIVDFLIFETKYSMYKLDFKKCSKSGWNDCHQECFMTDILFTSPPCMPDLLMAKAFKALVLHVFWAFHCFAMDSK